MLKVCAVDRKSNEVHRSRGLFIESLGNYWARKTVLCFPCLHLGRVMRKGPGRHDTWFRVICIWNLRQDGRSLMVRTFKERFLRFQLLFPGFYHFHHVIWGMKWAKKLKTKNGQNMSSEPFSHDAAHLWPEIVIHYLHNPIINLFYAPKILHNHCLQVLLGHEDVLREIKNNAYANFGGVKEVYYGICARSEWFQSEDNEVPAKEANRSGFELEPPIQFLRFWFEYALWPKKLPGFPSQGFAKDTVFFHDFESS